MNRRTVLFALAGFGSLAMACGGAQHGSSLASSQPTAHENRNVHGGEFVVVGRADGSGDAYDDTLLFERANAAVRTHRCDAAMPDYDRLLQQFPHSRYLAAVQYNRGVCLQSMGRADDAVTAFREAAHQSSDADLTRDAWFRVAVVGESAQRAPLVVEGTNAVLANPRAPIVDRVEALARQAAALLAQHDAAGATRVAQQAVDLVPTAEAVSALQDDTYIAEAKFVLAEVTRQQASAIEIRVEDAALEQAIERRVQLVVHAHVQFNDAIRVGNPHWAAACGYNIGEMYRALYDAIVNAPVPADWDAHAIGVYRQRTGTRLRPLLQGALRAWEATLDMSRRNGIADNDWARRAEQQIGSLRELVLNGGVPPAASASAGPASGEPRGTSASGPVASSGVVSASSAPSASESTGSSANEAHPASARGGSAGSRGH